MARVLVTGGAGYIGSVLVPMLLEKNHEVIVIDDFIYGQMPLLECCHNKKFTLVRGDVRNEELIDDIFERWMPDYVIPLAAIVGAKACDNNPDAAQTTNVDAIKLVLGRRWTPRILFPNTNSGYGIGQDGIYCTEETPLNPISLYGRSKVEAEKLILKNRNSIVLRLATVFGISPRPRVDLLVNDLVHIAATKGHTEIYEPHFKRNYIHVRDVARAFIHCMQNFNMMEGEVYNIGLSGANLSKWELCQEIQKQVPEFRFSEGKGEDPDKRNYIVSNEKLEKTGFKPQFSLRDGIAELIKGYQIIGQNRFSNA